MLKLYRYRFSLEFNYSIRACIEVVALNSADAVAKLDALTSVPGMMLNSWNFMAFEDGTYHASV